MNEALKNAIEVNREINLIEKEIEKFNARIATQPDQDQPLSEEDQKEAMILIETLEKISTRL